MSDWYYSLLGEEFGPVSVASLHELLQDGTLAGSDPVRRFDSHEPITGTEFQRLHPLTESPSADPNAKTSAEETADTEEPCDLFWFQLEGITLGPVSGHSLIKLAEIGRISQDTLIRRDNEFLWEAAAEFHELSIVFMLSQADEPQSVVSAGQSRPEQPPVADSGAEDSESDRDNGKPAAKPGKRSSGNTSRGAKTPAAAGRGQRSGSGSRKLVNRQRQAEAAAKAEAEDAMLQEIFAELEHKKAAARTAAVRTEETAAAVTATPVAAMAAAVPATAGPGASSYASDPRSQAAAALAAARSSSAAATAKPPKRKSSGGGFSIPNPFAGLSDLQFDGPVKTLIGVAAVALLWFGWGPVMSILNSQQGQYIVRVEETIQEIEKLDPAAQPDAYSKQMEKIGREFKAYSAVMTAAASQRQSAKLCLAAINRLVELSGTSPTNTKLQKKLLTEAKKLLEDYKG